MLGKKKLKDFIQSKEDFKDFSLRDLLNGRILTRSSLSGQLPFIVFIAFLGFVYIGNHYRVEKLMRQIDKLNKEVKELRYESITVSSELMFMSKQSEVSKRIRASNIILEEMTEPPRILKVKN